MQNADCLQAVEVENELRGVPSRGAGAGDSSCEWLREVLSDRNDLPVRRAGPLGGMESGALSSDINDKRFLIGSATILAEQFAVVNRKAVSGFSSRTRTTDRNRRSSNRFPKRSIR